MSDCCLKKYNIKAQYTLNEGDSKKLDHVVTKPMLSFVHAQRQDERRQTRNKVNTVSHQAIVAYTTES